MTRLGILGGTFDPIHEGHIALARQAIRSGQAEQVVFLPMARPAHREAEATADQRYHMCRLALEGQKDLLLSQAGMAPGVRYTADTLPLLNKEFPGAELRLILGGDKLKSLPDWYEADKLFAQCSFLCYPRDEIDLPKAAAKARKAGADIALIDAPSLSISSGRIRKQTRAYQDAPGLNRRVLCYMAENGLYQKDFLPKLKLMMNPRRFRHTLGVRQEAVRLADKHDLPIQKAALAGLLHDCAKGMRQEEMEKIARKHHLMSDESMLTSGALMHGPVGAYLAQKQFGITDEDVLNAIRSHTIGRPGMTGLELCIFVADATEPNREDYDGLEEIRALAEEFLTAAALKSMEMTKAYLERTGRPFFPVVLDTMKDLTGRLSPEEKMMLDATK
ncbi:MAG: bis(5'-nucleosyl)-tetraphosphatase (symmetrical) YqeK [Clostridia bacterium]|nr:bis(5'-nucleosyl)-tetraphosphatase (symmetrical) YqeK [Clostridia bacterium]